jgi:hypothetical protein
MAILLDNNTVHLPAECFFSQNRQLSITVQKIMVSYSIHYGIFSFLELTFSYSTKMNFKKGKLRHQNREIKAIFGDLFL